MITLNPIPFLLWPLILMVSAIDFYLFLTAARMVLGCFKNPQVQKLCRRLHPLTDAIPNGINAWLTRHATRYATLKTCWILALGGILLLRYIILFVLVWSSH